VRGVTLSAALLAADGRKYRALRRTSVSRITHWRRAGADGEGDSVSRVVYRNASPHGARRPTSTHASPPTNRAADFFPDPRAHRDGEAPHDAFGADGRDGMVSSAVHDAANRVIEITPQCSRPLDSRLACALRIRATRGLTRGPRRSIVWNSNEEMMKC
jgi:hypothetical protein